MASTFASPYRVTSRACETDLMSSPLAYEVSASPLWPVSSSTCDGNPQRVLVTGTTMTREAAESLRGSEDMTTAGLFQPCSCPTGSPKSTNHTSPRRGLVGITPNHP